MSGNVAPAQARDAVAVNHRPDPPSPLFVFALPRSFTSLGCAMLGQHPQLYGLPETHLLCERTVADWLGRAARTPWPMSHGLVRAVAQLYFGAQDETTTRLARSWLTARSDLDTEQVFKLLCDRVYPLRVVDKSPSTIDSVHTLQRAWTWFPEARFLHLVRHPRGYAESIMSLAQRKLARATIPPRHWLVEIAADPQSSDEDGAEGLLDPQHGWFERNVMIRDFLKAVPADRQLLLRGEELLQEPDRTLRTVAEWLGLRTDPEAIEEMKHPERSPYAFLGPPRARFGNDRMFLGQPSLRPGRGRTLSLDGPVSWRKGGEELLPHVKQLAVELGYS